MTFSTILSLPLDEVLGIEFTNPENRSWFAGWSGRLRGFDAAAARDWWPDWSQVVVSGGLARRAPTLSDWLKNPEPNTITDVPEQPLFPFEGRTLSERTLVDGGCRRG